MASIIGQVKKQQICFSLFQIIFRLISFDIPLFIPPFLLFFPLLGETIINEEHIGSGICLTMICSDICELKNDTRPCDVTPSPSPTPYVPVCPEWNVTVRIFMYLPHQIRQNTFFFFYILQRLDRLQFNICFLFKSAK